MKKFEDLANDVKKELLEAVKNDPYDLNVKTLYKNIYSSSGSMEMIATIFEVSTTLVARIKKS
jgi:hypothetical protein